MDMLNHTDIPARDAHFHNNWRRTMEPMDRGTRVTGLMQGKRGLIMGVANDHSIAWGIAKTLAKHGAELAFTYQGEALGKRVTPLAQSLGSDLVVPCDVEDIASVDAVFETLDRRWDGIDFVVHASASPTSRS